MITSINEFKSFLEKKKAKKKKLSDKDKEFISNKIKKLIDEGYPQKQAVAIAYSYLKRQNESLVKQKEDSHIFNYNQEINSIWRPLVKNAQDFQNINFDLENNDTTKDKRKIYITKNLRKDQPIKNEIAIELMKAGGDWEMPVLYFKIEFIHQHNIMNIDYKSNPEYIWDLETRYGKKYVLIPPVEAGNHLYKTDKGYCAYDHDSLASSNLKEADVRITDFDKKKAWKWIETLMEKVFNDRWKMLD